MRPSLKFREDRTFRIVQFTDVHWRNGEARDLLTERLMDRVLEAEKPDLVVITGDVIDSKSCLDPLASFRQAVAAADRGGIPWAVVFGNHDSEGAVTREALMETARAFPRCLAESGPESIGGVGNYILEVESSDGAGHTAALLYFFDSGDYAADPPGGYAWIGRDQIRWYAEQAARRRVGLPAPLPALAFFHIPLQEYKEVWELGECIGSKQEPVCSSAVNSGLFATFLEIGDVMGTFAGHDHINDYIGELHGIRLAYGRATGFNTYGMEGFSRGARVITLFEGERRFDTRIILEEDVLSE